jgi:hypothetical protein
MSGRLATVVSWDPGKVEGVQKGRGSKLVALQSFEARSGALVPALSPRCMQELAIHVMRVRARNGCFSACSPPPAALFVPHRYWDSTQWAISILSDQGPGLTDTSAKYAIISVRWALTGACACEIPDLRNGRWLLNKVSPPGHRRFQSLANGKVQSGRLRCTPGPRIRIGGMDK